MTSQTTMSEENTKFWNLGYQAGLMMAMQKCDMPFAKIPSDPLEKTLACGFTLACTSIKKAIICLLPPEAINVE
jgi:hypothetical protein